MTSTIEGFYVLLTTGFFPFRMQYICTSKCTISIAVHPPFQISLFSCVSSPTHLTVKMEFTGIQVMNTWGAHNFYPWFCHIRTHYNWLYGSDVWRICRDIEYESLWKCAVHFLSLSLLLCVYVRLFNVHKIKNIRNVNAFTLALITPMHIYMHFYILYWYMLCMYRKLHLRLWFWCAKKETDIYVVFHLVSA